MHILNNEVILEVTLLCKQVLQLEPNTSNWTNHIVCKEVKFLFIGMRPTVPSCSNEHYEKCASLCISGVYKVLIVLLAPFRQFDIWGPLYTMAKGHHHEIEALETHPKAVPWNMRLDSVGSESKVWKNGVALMWHHFPYNFCWAKPVWETNPQARFQSQVWK